jgi:hypothetical protein
MSEIVSGLLDLMVNSTGSRLSLVDAVKYRLEMLDF